MAMDQEDLEALIATMDTPLTDDASLQSAMAHDAPDFASLPPPPPPPAGTELQRVLAETDEEEEEDNGPVDPRLTMEGMLKTFAEEDAAAEARRAAEQEDEQNVLLVTPQAKVSELLLSEQARRYAGVPKAVVVHTAFAVPTANDAQNSGGSAGISIGTNHGVVLVFDSTQALRLLLTTPEAPDYGPVHLLAHHAQPASAANSNTPTEWLAACHERGQLVLWNLLTGKPLKVLQHSCPFLYAHWPDSGTLIACDVKGDVIELRISKGLFGGKGVDGPRTLYRFSSPPLAVAAYRPARVATALDQLSALAVVTEADVLLCQTAGQFAIRAKQPLASRTGRARCAVWSAASRVSPQPQLAVSSGSFVATYGVGGRDMFAIQLRFSHISDVELLACAWLGEGDALLLLNARDELRIVDPRMAKAVAVAPSPSSTNIAAPPPLLASSTDAAAPAGSPAPSTVEQVEVERLASASLEIVYNAKLRKGTVLYHASVTAGSTGRVVLLGLRNLYVAQLLTWRERLDLLSTAGRLDAALRLARRFYDGTGAAATDLPEDLKGVVGRSVIALVRQLVDAQLVKGASAEQLRHAASVCIEYCVAVARPEVLFGELFARFQSAGAAASGAFLDSLPPWLEKGALPTLPPAVLHAFVAHFKGALHVVEAAILQLQLASIDFHLVATLCKQHRLYAALIYLYTRGLNDFLTPLELLVDEVQKNGPQRAVDELVKYASASLRGRLAYGTGAGNEIPRAQQATVRAQFLNYVFAADPRTGNASSAYSRVRALLERDVVGALKLAAVAFEDEPIVLTPDDAPSSAAPAPARPSRDDMLKRLSVAAQATGKARIQDALYEFMGKEYALGHTTLTDADFAAMLVSLLGKGEGASVDRQEVLVAALEKGTGRYNDDRVLMQAQEAGLFRVVAALHRRKRNWPGVIRATLADQKDRTSIFGVVRQLMADGTVGDEARAMVKSTTLTHLADLVRIDSAAASLLMMELFADEHEAVLKQLCEHRDLQYAYMRSILEQSTRPSAMTDYLERSNTAITSDMHETYIELMCEFAPADVYPYLLAHESAYRLEHCLELMKRYTVITDAMAYLLERTGDVTNALELILRNLEDRMLALKAQYAAASSGTADAPLLSPRSAALRTMTTTGPKQPLKAAAVPAAPASPSPTATKLGAFPSTAAEHAVVETLDVAIALCQRNSQRLEHAERDALWFKLLDKLVIPLRKLKVRQHRMQGSTHSGIAGRERAFANQRRGDTLDSLDPTVEMKGALTSLIHHILYNMMGYVALPSILDKIVRDHGSDQFGDFKSIFISMLDNYRYEQTILKTATRLIQHDMHNTTKELRHVRSKPLAPRGFATVSCGLCNAPPHAPALNVATEDEERLRQLLTVFRCGHTFHASCLQRAPRCPLCVSKKADKKMLATMKENLSKKGKADVVVPPSVGLQASDARQHSTPLAAADVYVARLAFLHRSSEGSRLPLLNAVLRDDRDRAAHTHRGGAGVSAGDDEGYAPSGPGGVQPSAQARRRPAGTIIGGGRREARRLTTADVETLKNS